MEGKMKAGLLAMLCLFGMGFAWGMPGLMESGWGNPSAGDAGMAPQGMERQWNASVEARAEFMQATHEGDYETAMALHEEYGLGGKRMEHTTPEMFELGAQIFSAQVAGNWLEAVGLQDELMELVMETMQAHFQEQHEACAAFMENEEVQELMKEAHEAMQEGDTEKAAEIREQLKEIIPKECAPRMHGQAPMEMSGECKEALEGNEEAQALMGQINEAIQAKDQEKAKELEGQLRELLPGDCQEKQHGMRGHGMKEFHQDD